MIRLYEAIEEKCGTGFEVSYQTINEDSEKTLGIFLYQSSNDAEDLSGETIYECIKIHLQVNAENSENGLKEGLNFLRHCVYRLEAENSAIQGIDFIRCTHLGPKAIVTGKNSFGKFVLSSNLDLLYIID